MMKWGRKFSTLMIRFVPLIFIVLPISMVTKPSLLVSLSMMLSLTDFHFPLTEGGTATSVCFLITVSRAGGVGVDGFAGSSFLLQPEKTPSAQTVPAVINKTSCRNIKLLGISLAIKWRRERDSN